MGGIVSILPTLAAVAVSLVTTLRSLGKPERETPAMEHLQRTAAEAQERAAQAERAASAANTEADTARAKANAAEAGASAAKAELEATQIRNRATEAQVKAERDAAKEQLRQGIRQVVSPTFAEVEEMKARYLYSPDKIHLAIAGWTGVGKSSLINAFRGLKPGAPNAAGTSVVEGTRVVTRYPDPNEPKLVWFDVPGAGTLSCRDWMYCNDQGLYIFDSILVVFSDRFIESDIAILRNCQLWSIPAYIVRSKADIHVDNIIKGWQAEQDEDEDEDEGEDQIARAKGQFEEETRKYVTEELTRAGLPTHELFIVSQYALKDKVAPPRRASKYTSFDEEKLIVRLFKDVLRRRFPTKDRMWWSSSSV